MKAYIVVVCALLHFTQSKVIPDYLQNLVCRKSNPKYEECLWDHIEKARPAFYKGIPELNMPPIDPFELPLMTVDRTLNELVSIQAIMKNIKMTGAKDMVIERIKADPINKIGEIRVNLPFVTLTMEHAVNGQLLRIPLRTKGHFEGNFTNTQIYVRASMKEVEIEGVPYFRIDKMDSKLRVGDGHIKLTAKNPQLQFGADLIANFYNENPREAMDAVNPIFVETSTQLFRIVADQILASAPAKEWLPE